MTTRIACLINDQRETLVLDYKDNTIRLVAFSDYMDETPDIMIHPVRGLLHVAQRCRYDRDAQFGIIGTGEDAVLTVNSTTVLLMAQSGITEEQLNRFLPARDAAQAWADMVLCAIQWAQGVMDGQGSA